MTMPLLVGGLLVMLTVLIQGFGSPGLLRFLFKLDQLSAALNPWAAAPRRNAVTASEAASLAEIDLCRVEQSGRRS